MFGRWIRAGNRFHQEVLGMNRRNIQCVYPWNPRKWYMLADDKIQTKAWLQELQIPVPRTLRVLEAFGEIVTFLEEAPRMPPFVIKPARGRGGMGIWIVQSWNPEIQKFQIGTRTYRTLDDMREHLASILFGNFSWGRRDRVLIEEKIHPHPFFREIFPEGVPDIRIIVFHAQPVMAMLRMPTVASRGRANLHQGGVGVGIDLKSGQLQDVYFRRRYIPCHPDTGVPVRGKHLPFWRECLHIARTLGMHSPLKYLGIDIIIQSVGPVVMEINVRPGLEIQNVNRTGLWKRIQQVRQE